VALFIGMDDPVQLTIIEDIFPMIQENILSVFQVEEFLSSNLH